MYDGSKPLADRSFTDSITQKVDWKARLPDLGLTLVLLIAIALRFVGLGWDGNTHMHPDERFLTMVEGSLRLPEDLGQYFDTATSPLNPHNVGHRFFVYGTLPIFIVRLLGEWMSKLGYDEIHLVGRAASAAFDVISVALIYLIGLRLYRRRVALLAAAFSAMSVTLIQHAHFFTVDSFANTFVLAGFYFAVRVFQVGRLRDYALFGLTLGMAVASKINTAPLAAVVALAAFARWLSMPTEEREKEILPILGALIMAALVSLLTFRVLMPYAFTGPTFFGLGLNPAWLQNMSDIRDMLSGRVDFPPALQWVNRLPVLFSLKNMVLWGMGLPLGLLSWVGWGWAFLRVVRGDWKPHLLPVAWVGGYFLWQSMGFTIAMRYQMPIYPIIALLGAWAIWEAWDRSAGWTTGRVTWGRYAVGGLAGFLLLSTALYAVAFTRIYITPFTRLAATRWIYSHIPAAVNLTLQTPDGEQLEPIPLPPDVILSAGAPYVVGFTAHADGEAETILLPFVTDRSPGQPGRLILTVESPDAENQLARAEYDGVLASNGEAGSEVRLELDLDEPLSVQAGVRYNVRFEVQGAAEMSLRGSRLINETGWDDALPLRADGLDGFGGLYTGMSLELYWDDDQDGDGNGISDKLERIVDMLSQGDLLTISSNRQYGSIARVPERYPLTTAFYRALFGCPVPEEVWRCAAQAKPSQMEGELGYDLVAVFESNPSIGPLEINDQGAEETFTVYDHPKVLLFAKDEGFSTRRVREVLGAVDVSDVLHATPREMGSPSPPVKVGPTLTLPEDRLEEQRRGGTWSELYNRRSLINLSQPLAVMAWWVLIGVIGLLAMPLTWTAFPGLRDRGYPLARLFGLLTVSWGSWLLGSLRVPFRQTTILLVTFALAAVSAFLAWRDREGLTVFLKRHRREIVWTELLALGFFLFDLAIRLGNPDLWHPSKGGEKPMDFSYLNAVLKSTSFPPYDPWFAGGYINYYYFGFVIVGIPIKLLGLNPSVGYNLVIPTLFSLTALTAYSVGYNLVARAGEAYPTVVRVSPRLAGIAAAVALVVLGNLGTVLLLYRGFRQIGAMPGGLSLGFLDAIRGLGRFLSFNNPLPYPIDAWYWDPSRAIPPGPGEFAGPITEFPFFTFLYADLHAHMINLPLTVLSLAWGISWLVAAVEGKRRGWSGLVFGLFAGGLALGALNPTNTWDFPVYWTLGVLAAVAGPWVSTVAKERQTAGTGLSEEESRPLSDRTIDADPQVEWIWRFLRRAFESVLTATVLIGLAFILFRPFSLWYGRGYTAADMWKGSRTALDAYLTVHGLPVFVLLTWLVWETRQWMAVTPISALSRLRPALGVIGATAVMLVGGIGLLTGKGFEITPLVALLVIWPGVLLTRREFPVEKRVALIMTATAAALTFVVDVVVLRGDIGRMNTVFKFYIQVWTLFNLASGAALFWLIADMPSWGDGLRQLWGLTLGVLVTGALLYPITATGAKVRDRMASDAPHSLDGMAFMPYSTYYDLGQAVDLAEDYRAIRWMQDNVEGSPVILEANLPEYRWGSRFTIYTGLPGVLGWRWHQVQQRVADPDSQVVDRAHAITDFYLTQSVEEARRFLEAYDVQYVIVGNMERLFYETVSPCTAIEGTATVTCDMGGRPEGMSPPDVPPSECEPLDPQNPGMGLVCPTHGLEKFDRMAQEGILSPVYRDGGTVIYEVLP